MPCFCAQCMAANHSRRLNNPPCVLQDAAALLGSEELDPERW